MMAPMATQSPDQQEYPAPADRIAASFAAAILHNRPLLERLGELRRRLFACAGTFLGALVVAWIAYPAILDLLVIPLQHLPGATQIVARGHLVFTSPTEAFAVRVKVVTYSGGLLASPVVLWQLWRFLGPPGPGAKAKKANRAAFALVASSLVLFAAGGFAAFLFVYPALKIFLYLGGSHIVLVPRASSYLSFLLLLIVAFGLTFEYPMVLLGLIFIGVIDSRSLRRRRRLAYFVLLVVSVVVTPTVDPITPIALAVPLGILYEATIAVARLLKH
ncbi:MAG TPA: twin-arginine translocase subunit TatC [Actinomycetota bacterium]|nr:twin-arginine translocase subunit TatC [Actinomycetota bacterium]